MLKKLSFGIVLALCLMQVCEGIKCYKCSSTIDLTCTDDASAVNDKNKVDCSIESRPNNLPAGPDHATQCNKIVAKDTAGVTVSRGCHWEVTGKDPKVCTVTAGQQLESCKLCNENYCNSAPTNLVAFGVPALIAAVIGARALW